MQKSRAIYFRVKTLKTKLKVLLKSNLLYIYLYIYIYIYILDLSNTFSLVFNVFTLKYIYIYIY